MVTHNAPTIMKMLRRLLIAATLVVCASCDSTIHFYPDEDEGGDRYRVRLNVDWSGYTKTTPTGMTVILHHAVTGEQTKTIDNNTSYITPKLSRGRYWATVFSLTESEYNYIGFRGFEDPATAEAYAVSSPAVRWYSKRGDDREIIASQPEWLAVDTIMTDDFTSSVDNVDDIVIGTLHPKNIIYTLHVTLRTENVANLRSARGVISGMASGRKFASDKPNDNTVTATHLLESDMWTRSRGTTDPEIGLIKADIRCFGLPGNHRGLPEENVLEFQALLNDGQTVKTYSIPVGNLITEATPPQGRRGDNLDLYLDITLDPPLPAGDGDWGFDVWVEDWEEEVVDIGI